MTMKRHSICDQAILVTGGTGSFGRAFVKRVLNDCPQIRRLVIYSRDELKQYEMSKEFPASKYPSIRYFIGDIRDKERLKQAMEGVDTVVHAAALKQVPAAEYNPFEFVKTNIIGTQNVVDSAIETGVQRLVALSTDKAAAPINLYGATKLCADKLVTASNNYKGGRTYRASVVRYGNVMGSRGSVFPLFMEQASARASITITDANMTRFNITLDAGVEMVMWALSMALGGEILVPRIPSYRIIDVAEAIAPSLKSEFVGIRPGEKIHEEMITQADAPNTLQLGDYYAIIGSGLDRIYDAYVKSFKAIPVNESFCYQSGTNSEFLTVNQIRSLIKDHLNPTFCPV
ncbi:MAG: UDP-N-acetylglucosamine 4,6-dehydratase (inverting) [Proteobacteria bacterium]|nr:UDP-N-acetylglucosamine 4,6-dehydratase (inverting) [Pseudomonadota bacterium]